MNILHISRTMGQGGAEKVVYQLCTINSCNKCFVASTGGFYVNDLEKNNVNHLSIPDIANKNPILIFKTIKELSKIIKKEKIDIIHSHHRMASFYAQLLKIKYKNIKLIYTAHNVFYDKKRLLKFSLRNTEIIAVGDGVKKNLIEVYGISNKQIEVIYNSIKIDIKGSVDKRLKELKGSGKILVGNIGRLSEQKGFDIFINSISESLKTNPNIVGIVVGDGEDKQKLKKIVKDLNIEKNIIFLGYRNDIFDIIKQVDFVVLSSRWEGFPLTPIEVFSQSKTIIASNISGNNEIVKDKINGLLFTKEDISDLKDKILLLSNDLEMRKNLEKKARISYEKNYSYDVFEEKYQNVYNKYNITGGIK